MDWNYLRTFHAVAETGSLAGAVARLGNSHATAFRHIKALETDLGTRLFDKTQGRYKLTEAGGEIHQLAQTVAIAFDDIERRGSGTDIQLKGRIRLTAPASFACHYLPGYLATFRRTYPDITVELLSTNEELNMNNRAAEIALRVTSSPPEHLVGRKLADIPWGVYASPAYLKMHGKPACPSDLAQHKLIGAAGTLTRQEGFAWIDRDHRDRVVARSDDLMTVAALARQGLGLALLPVDVAQQGLERTLSLEWLRHNQLWLLTHPDLRKVERVRCMMQFLSRSFGSEQDFEGH